jgi:iron complex outermembrane recepter protein
MTARKLDLLRLSKAMLCATTCASALAVVPAYAGGQVTDLGIVQEKVTVEGTAVTDSATYQAPSQTPLSAIEPSSVVSQHFIQNNIPLSSNYEDVVNVTPSVYTVSPNGPGLAENLGVSIRGFQDGQFNMTFDGIPWGDSNDFTHHSTSYFMMHDIGQVSVNRGPGTAATLGTSTFGGTVALLSKDPSSTESIDPYASFGSFNTRVLGLQLDSGEISGLHDTSAFLDVENLNSSGRLTYSGQRRSNAFAKIVTPISNNTVVTFAAMYNQIHQYVPQVGQTLAEIKTNYNYSLSNNPNSQDYYGYNYDRITTDFEYIDVQSRFGDGWALDNKVYTYAYFHHGFNGEDATGGTPNGTYYSPTDVPGQKMRMVYRSFGDFARFAKDVPFGQLEAGFWYDHQLNKRFLYEIDATLGPDYLNPPTLPASALYGGATDRLMTDTLDNFQPYFEVHWKPLPGLTITPGVKYAFFRRTLNAVVNDGTSMSLNFSHNYTSLLPSFDAHYAISPHWSAYVQVAKGFLAPKLQLLKTTTPQDNTFRPEQTWNYQIGTAYQADRLSLSGDLYYIDFSNLIGKQKIGNNTFFVNNGGAKYQGVELEGTYYVGEGFSLFANGSLNQAKYNDHFWVGGTPKQTASFGLIFNKDNIYASLMTKYNGSQYGDDDNNQVPLGGFAVTDLAVSYTFQPVLEQTKGFKLSLKVNNLFDRHALSQFAGYAADGVTPLFWTLTGRNFFVSLSAPF